jgi:hypothetical protein
MAPYSGYVALLFVFNSVFWFAGEENGCKFLPLE